MTDIQPKDSDRSRVAAILGDSRLLDAPDTHIQLAAPLRGDLGVATWREPATGEEPALGAVVMPPTATRQDMYRLVLACAEDARTRGFSRGGVRIQDGRLLAQLRRDFSIAPTPCAWEPNTGRPVEWAFEVDLDDAIRQLREALS